VSVPGLPLTLLMLVLLVLPARCWYQLVPAPPVPLVLVLV
jgi:hypothetical protein